MLFNKLKFIMVHHLHDNSNFKAVKGSIHVNKFHEIVSKSKNNTVFTFDDGYKSQLHLGAKILEKYNKKGIFFLNTNILENKINFHELSKFAASLFFKNQKEFNIFYLEHCKSSKIKKNEIRKYKKKFPFYSEDEIYIRIIRDNHYPLYINNLKKIFKIMRFKYKFYAKKIFLTKKEVIQLSKYHIIGLHTHSHPYNFDQLSEKNQTFEIEKNKEILGYILKKKINLFSYPVGNYNKVTTRLLKKFGIKYAFINLNLKLKNNFMIPRININKLKC
jgi:peptidoglycan/xylan/chitin deacetylase (PgdA/CDA1 family)